MKQLINSTRIKSGELQRTAVLRLEMDYELATLFEAMEDSDKPKMMECKQKLERIRQELVRLEAL
ncbi:hypothetical protein [Mesobacillus subterraneus]|uniref:Uncharacterized protein n=1 Tax=Mesobacillus subterraneus TaxID=285983 RepID=A0A0D6Z6L2_9BACI|nr:hypothetical protein [Mesobacillus subterraneus]KIY21222.1 hypothetical protein UB32_14915 [Mesobacillus subterraneus]